MLGIPATLLAFEGRFRCSTKQKDFLLEMVPNELGIARKLTIGIGLVGQQFNPDSAVEAPNSPAAWSPAVAEAPDAEVAKEFCAWAPIRMPLNVSARHHCTLSA
jgi:hypothetical protein